MTLKRHIGMIGLTFVAVGGVMGSGWIFGPLTAATIAGPASIIAWALGGLGMLILALSYAEVSSILPVAGGTARLPIFSHGNLVAAVMGWTAWLGYNTTAAIETIALLDYLAFFFPSLRASLNQQFVLSWSGMLVGILLLAGFVYINALGVKFFARANTSVTWFKIGIPIIIALGLLCFNFHPENFTNYGGFMPSGWPSVFAAISMGGVVFSFVGFRHAIDMAGETKNPARNIPLALLLSVLLCLCIYELLQVAFIGAISADELANGWQNMHLGGQWGPLAGLLVALGVAWLTVLLYVGVIASPFGAALVSTGSSGRLVLAMAQHRLFPPYFATLSSKSVPLKGMWLNWFAGALVIMFLSFEESVALNSASIIFSFSMGPIAVYCFRRQFIDLPRRFKLPWVQIFGLVGLSVASLMVHWSGWRVFTIMIAVLLMVAIVFTGRSLFSQKKSIELDGKHASWLLPYLVGLGLLGYFGEYGGISLLVFPIGDVLVLILSIVTFYLAYYLRLPNKRAQANFEQAFEAGNQSRLGILDEKIP